jgi:ribosomal protein S18 acetylase RimI-like enzyme
MQSNEWMITPSAADAEALATLADDRCWCGYAIADLDPLFRPYTQVAVARRPSGASAACSLFRHPDFTALIPHGTADGLAALLASMALPERTFLHVRPEQRALLERYYLAPSDLHEMWRMALTPRDFQPPSAPPVKIVRLSMGDLAALDDLYATYAGSAFTADQLRTGVFYGVCEEIRLIAAGGTHVVSPAHQIAAVGNVFTRPEVRGRGYATALTGAVVAALFAEGCADVILNVAVDNAPAIAVYERLGFHKYCRYWEGSVERR